MCERLAVMAKAPRVGTVKTRLHRALGAEGATALYRCLVRDTFALVGRVCNARASVSAVLCYAPEEAVDAFEGLADPAAAAIAQRGADLGERLTNCLHDLFDLGALRAVVIGADGPTLPAAFLVEAFEALATGADVVLGPTADGGYYLVGLRAPHDALFAAIPWSTNRVLAATLERAAAADLSVALLPEWYDVDEPADLERLRADLASCPSTRAFFDES